MGHGDVSQVDVELLMEEVHRRIRGGGDPAVRPSMPAQVADLMLLRSGYDISQATFTSHRRLLGPIVVYVKYALRRLLTPILERQTAYNTTVGRVVARLSEHAEVVDRQLGALHRETEQLLRRQEALEARLGAVSICQQIDAPRREVKQLLKRLDDLMQARRNAISPEE